VRGVLFDFPRDDAQDGGSGVDHTDGVACTSATAGQPNGPNCGQSYLTVSGSTFLGLIYHTSGGTSSANTNSFGMQDGDNVYSFHLVTDNYISGWNAIQAARTGGSGSMWANNWFGSEWAPLNNVLIQNFPSNSIWAGNKWNYQPSRPPSTWLYPTPSDDGKFWWLTDGGTTVKHVTDYLGNTQVPYPEPQCNDGVDNDGDGNIDYPWDATCANAWGAAE
jgi:hypothetical protein